MIRACAYCSDVPPVVPALSRLDGIFWAIVAVIDQVIRRTEGRAKKSLRSWWDTLAGGENGEPLRRRHVPRAACDPSLSVQLEPPRYDRIDFGTDEHRISSDGLSVFCPELTPTGVGSCPTVQRMRPILLG